MKSEVKSNVVLLSKPKPNTRQDSQEEFVGSNIKTILTPTERHSYSNWIFLFKMGKVEDKIFGYKITSEISKCKFHLST